MRHPSQNRRIFGICCLLLSLAAAGHVRAAGIGDGGGGRGGPGKTPSLEGGDLGVGLFSNIPFHVTIGVRGGYDDNSNTGTSSGGNQGSEFVNGTINLTYDFGSPRTRLSLQTGGGLNYYVDRPGKKDPDYNAYLGLSLKHNFSARLILNVSAYAAYQAEPDFSIATGVNRRSGNYFYTTDNFTLNYLWTPRFSTGTTYTFHALLYDNTGSSGVGSFENRIENTFGNEFRFLFWPTTTLVAEYRIQFISYQSTDADAVAQFILVGFDHSFSPQLRATFRGGFQIRSLDSSQVVPASFQLVNGVFVFVPEHTVHTSTDSSSPYFEATVNYQVGKKTSVNWTNRYGIEEPDIPGQPRRVTYRTGLEGKHNWTPRISSQLAVYYAHNDYSASTTTPAFVEDSIDVALSLRYAITRYLGVDVGYNHTDVLSDAAARGYSRNRFYAGADFTF